MARNADARGRFVWYDLSTTDTDGAIRFYTKLFGWGTQEWKGGESPYTMWENAGTSIGGVMDLPQGARDMGAPPHWMAYIGTPDVDETVRRAQQLGAQVYAGPMDIPDIGRFAVLADPQGAVFAAFSSPDEPPPEKAQPDVGEVSWHELMTTDYAAAFDFYRDLFGWEKLEGMDMGDLGVYQLFGRNGRTVGGMFNRMAEMAEIPPNWLIYFRVNDIDRKVEEVRNNGGTVMNGPMEVPGGDMIAQCMDPQGAAFAIHQSKTS